MARSNVHRKGISIMQHTLRRKLALGLTGALMTALSIVAVAPVGATDPMTAQLDANAIQAQATLNGNNNDVTAGYSGPVYGAPIYAPPPFTYTQPAYIQPTYAQPGFTYTQPTNTLPAPVAFPYGLPPGVAIQGYPTTYYPGQVPAYVRVDPDGETSGNYQIDYSAGD